MRGLAFVLFNVPFAIAIWAVPNVANGDATWESPSVFSTVPQGEHFDYLFMGTSHARYFSVTQPNHETFERALGGPVMNIAQNAAGPRVQTVYLSYFLSRGNSADTVIYLLDPWAVVHETWNRTYTFQREPFRVRPFVDMLRVGFPLPDVFADYVLFNLQGRSFSREGNPFSPLERVEDDGEPIPAEYIADREAFLNGPWRDRDDVNHLQNGYTRYLLDIAETARARGMRLVFVYPSVLIPPQVAQEQLSEFLRAREDEYGFELIDLSQTISDHRLYNDPDHLNTDGIEYFTSTFLRPALASHTDR